MSSGPVYNRGMAKKGKRRIEGTRELGETIRRIRKEQGLSLVELSDKANLSPSHLSEIELGKTTNPGAAALHKIATALGVDLSFSAGESVRSSGLSVVLESPFTLQELERMGSRRYDVLSEIKAVLEDPNLSFEQRKRIAETLVTMAEWLRDRELRDRTPQSG